MPPCDTVRSRSYLWHRRPARPCRVTEDPRNGHQGDARPCRRAASRSSRRCAASRPDRRRQAEAASIERLRRRGQRGLHHPHVPQVPRDAAALAVRPAPDDGRRYPQPAVVPGLSSGRKRRGSARPARRPRSASGNIFGFGGVLDGAGHHDRDDRRSGNSRRTGRGRIERWSSLSLLPAHPTNSPADASHRRRSLLARLCSASPGERPCRIPVSARARAPEILSWSKRADERMKSG